MSKLIKMDVTDIMANVTRQLPTRSDMQEVRRNIGTSALKYWKDQAQQKLKSTSRDYAQGLSYREQGSRVFVILSGQLPNMIENGFPGGDMRTWMLKGPNAKMGKNGMYNTVAFRHGTPGTTGRNVGPVMPRIVHNAAKKLQEPTLSQAKKLTQQGGQPVLYGTRLHPQMRKASKQLREILTTKKKPWHTTSIYTGMIREEKTYESGTQPQYTTFRRISQHSPHPESWIHPGIKPRHFAKATREHMHRMIPGMIRAALEGPGRGGSQ